MSFLKPAAGAAGALPAANFASTGLGHMIGVDPSRISSIANSIGTGMNGIATAGGAVPAYANPNAQQQQGQPNNYLQMADPDILHQVLAKFNIAPMKTGYSQ